MSFISVSKFNFNSSSKCIVFNSTCFHNIFQTWPKKCLAFKLLNTTEPGEFEFEKPSFVFKENVGFAQIPVCRLNGADGKVTVEWMTEDISAIEGRDYKGRKGVLVFESGEVKKNLEILIINDEVGWEAYRSKCVCGLVWMCLRDVL